MDLKGKIEMKNPELHLGIFEEFKGDLKGVTTDATQFSRNDMKAVFVGGKLSLLFLSHSNVLNGRDWRISSMTSTDTLSTRFVKLRGP